MKKLFTPVLFFGGILVRWVGVPLYRTFFFSKRVAAKIFQPAKHRFLYLITNRYSIHIIMGIIVVLVGVINFQAHGVRAETFGQKSILYSLVATDDLQQLEIVEAGAINPTAVGTSYYEDLVLNEQSHIDYDSLEEESEWGEANKNVPIRSGIETYTIKEGDTLGKISQQFGLSVSTILWANNLTLKSTIRPGDELTILPEDGVMYKVKSGDTLSKIAKAYSIDSEKILAANQIADSGSLKIGAQLILPGGEPPATVTQIVKKPVSVKDIFTSPTPRGSSTGTGTWVWPTNWRVITQYYGWKHTGLDIDGDYTTFSLAAHDGVVKFAGWKTSYGYTIDVDHGDGIVTRYAHNSKIFVSVGQSVSAGQRLAQTGSTGRSTGTHLHFEVIKNGVRQNPLSYIR